jgi:hypothetical protein
MAKKSATNFARVMASGLTVTARSLVVSFVDHLSEASSSGSAPICEAAQGFGAEPNQPFAWGLIRSDVAG